jgi:hypothetical protein
MYKGKFNKTVFAFFLAIMMLVTSSLVLAQDTTSPVPYGSSSKSGKTGVATLAKDLQSKLNLSQTQTDSVQAILTDYQSSLMSSGSSMGNQQMSGTADPQQKADSRIEALLNSTQKSTYKTVKSDWWSKVKSALSS